MSNIQVNIDELVLNGFPPEQHEEIRGAFRAELTRLFSEGNFKPAARENVAAHRAQGTPHAIGVQAARATFGRVSR